MPYPADRGFKTGEVKGLPLQSFLTVPGCVHVTAISARSSVLPRFRELLRAETAATVAHAADVDDELRHLVEILLGGNGTPPIA